MTENSSSDSDDATIEPRTRRARTEDMLVALRRSGGIYSVRGESGNTYRVDVATGECSCPDHQQRGTERCKHLRRVELEIRNRSVPTPDGRLPERPVADGGADFGGLEEPDETHRVKGPIQEIDRYGRPTGAA